MTSRLAVARRPSPVKGAMLCLTLVLAACGADGPVAPEGIFFPTVPRQDAYPTALMSDGVLEERSGCLFMVVGKERWLLLWPEGYTAKTAQGRIEVLDEDGGLVGTEGERLSVAGGEMNPVEVGGAAAAHEWATGMTGGDIPERCGDLYWLVAP